MVVGRIPARAVFCLAILVLGACRTAEPVVSQLSTIATPDAARSAVATGAPLTSAPTAMPTSSPERATAATTEQVIPNARMSVSRAAHSATLLTTGLVLIAGGCVLPSCETGEHSASAELFDPATGAFTPMSSMTIPHVGATSHANVFTRTSDSRYQ